MPPPSKTCVSCGRTITWRKKWERDWDEVRYCSTACRRRGVGADDVDLERRILDLLDVGGRTADVGSSDEPMRRAARRLVARGEVQIVQRGSVVDPSTAKGPFTVRRAR